MRLSSPVVLLCTVAAIASVPSAEALFGKGKGKAKANEEEMERASTDIHTGMSGLSAAARDPDAMKGLMEAAQDPEMIKAAQEMMNDPAFKAQMEEMMKDPAFVEQQRMMAEQFADPRKAAAMEQQFEQFMQGAGQNKEQILAGNAKDARRRARAHAHADQASDPEEAYNALKRGGVDVGLSGPQGGLDDALSMLNDPQARAEIQKMMSDPDFADKFQAMSNDPKFAAAMDHAKGVMAEAMSDPAKMAEMEAKVKAMYGGR